ncbi:unnamed protein product, partial [Linum tenue]
GPPDEGHRKAVERFTKHRLKFCQEEEEEDWEAIEKRLGGQLEEELIEEARDEFNLIEKMVGESGMPVVFLMTINAVPLEEGYLKAVESLIKRRLKVCHAMVDRKAIEKRLGCGQVKELKEDARDELKLVEKMVELVPWGVPDEYECEVTEDDVLVPKHEE